MPQKTISAVLFLAIASLCFLPALAQEKPTPLAHPLYPLEVGHKWTYRVGDQKVVVRVDRLEAIDMKKNGKVEKVEKVAAHRLVITNNDRELNEYVAVLADGIYRFAGDDKETSPPLRFLKLKVEPDESWECQMTVQGTPLKGKFTASEGEVTVPAGTFKAIIASSSDFQIGTQKLAVKYWFGYEVARGGKDQRTWEPAKVGIVKQETRYGTLSVTMELEKFEPAAK